MEETSPKGCELDGIWMIRAIGGGSVTSLCLSSLSCAGSIRMLKDEMKQWELQVDHSLFAIGKLDVTVSM